MPITSIRYLARENGTGVRGIGMVLWNHRMLHIDADSRYADIVERVLYNGAISGVSLDGDKFFYDNPLASSGNHHRSQWFGTACCPPNISRLLASLGGYIYSEAPDAAFVHLYISGSAQLMLGDRSVKLRQESNYPWEGDIEITVDLAPEPLEFPGAPEVCEQHTFELWLRIPGWCRKFTVAINGDVIDADTHSLGYICLHRTWRSGDRVNLSLNMPVERVYSHPNVKQNAGKVALQRGPVVYCLEEADHEIPLHRIVLPKDTTLTAQFDEELLGGIVKIEGEALWRTELPSKNAEGAKGENADKASQSDQGRKGDKSARNDLYTTERYPLELVAITAIPYYAWDHRTPGEMTVWIEEA